MPEGVKPEIPDFCFFAQRFHDALPVLIGPFNPFLPSTAARKPIPPRVAARLAVTAAEAIDLELEKADEDLISDIWQLGERFRLYRSEHRKLHLDQIESLLKMRTGKQ